MFKNMKNSFIKCITYSFCKIILLLLKIKTISVSNFFLYSETFELIHFVLIVHSTYYKRCYQKYFIHGPNCFSVFIFR